MEPEYELWAWGPGLGQLSFDPFCLSIITYLQLAGIPWKLHVTTNWKRSNTGRLPVLRHGAVTAHGTTEILKLLSKRPFDLDGRLSPSELADHAALIAMIEETLHDAWLYTLWVERANFAEITEKHIPMSWIERRYLPYLLREQAQARLAGAYGMASVFVRDADREHDDDTCDRSAAPTRPVASTGAFRPESHGLLGKHTYPASDAPLDADAARVAKRIFGAARACYAALEARMGDGVFLGGATPAALDAVVYGHLALHLAPSLSVPHLSSMLAFEFPRLCALVKGLEQRLQQATHGDVSEALAALAPPPPSRTSWCLSTITSRAVGLLHPQSLLASSWQAVRTWWGPKRHQRQDDVPLRSRLLVWAEVAGALGLFVYYIRYHRLIRIEYQG